MLVALFAAASAAAAPAGYQPPVWLRKPTGSDFANVFPAHAQANRISGEAKIRCVVNIHGLLEQCTVVEESPLGEGFGAAALLLAPTFMMRPPTGPHGPTTGVVNIPIRFLVSGRLSDAPSSAIGASRSPYAGGSRFSSAKSAFDSVIVQPTWSAAPSFADVAAAYPVGAGGVSGHVVLRCRVVAGGALKNCGTQLEYPPGKGFLGAAKSLVARFRLATPAEAGWSYVDVPVSFVDPSSAEFRERRIGAPTWRVELDPAKVAQVFPEEAAAKGIKTGRGVAKCEVAQDGALTGCQEMPGDPDGLGFSHAAVVVAGAMAMNPWTDEGGPVDGAVITLPIRFNLAAPAGAQSASK
jgi:TonB family protein